MWSPDSSKVVAYRVRPGYRRLVHYVASSPEDQLQPEHWAAQYAKPGDLLDLEQPVLFDVRSQKQIAIDSQLFPNPYDMSDLVWRKDSRAFTLRIQPARPPGVSRHRSRRADRRRARGHLRRAEDVLLLQPLAPRRCRPASAIATTSPTARKSSGCRSATAGIISISIDGATGAVKNQITKGAWPVRHVIKVDEEKRQLWFSAGGMTRRARIRTSSTTTASISTAPA